jgi:hypothetical protein
MDRTGEPQVSADVRSLLVTIARSSIVIPLAVRLADWKTTRTSADIDDVVLAWLASHRGPRARHFDA